MTLRLPDSLSVYRGQADKGIGEGPGRPIDGGEQYLYGTDDPLAQDSGLLQAIRPWLSLDMDPADPQRLGRRLEAWSCFTQNDRWFFVTRLVSAGSYDRRAAYFAHARAWPLADCKDGFDPGVYLGYSEAFDKPDCQRGDSTRILTATSPLQVLEIWLEPVGQEYDVAVLLLGHLFQALEHQYPLLLAVPLREFASDRTLPKLVSFARAALPGDLKKQCSIRIYTHTPELFLQRVSTSLVVLTDTVAETLSIGRNATLLDRQGKVQKGCALEPRALAYARAVLDAALQFPKELLPFSERFAGVHKETGLPADDDDRSVRILYNLVRARSEADFEHLFREQLVPLEPPSLPWQQLFQTEDWRCFPRRSLVEFVLQDSATLGSNGRELQNALVAALGELELTGDDYLAGWWNAQDDYKLGRLLQLLTFAPGLFSAQVAARCTVAIPLARHRKLGEPLTGLLEIERQAGMLGRRVQERVDLAELVAEPEHYQTLLHFGETLDPLGKLEDLEIYLPLAEILAKADDNPLVRHLLDEGDKSGWARIEGDVAGRLLSWQPLRKVLDISTLLQLAGSCCEWYEQQSHKVRQEEEQQCIKPVYAEINARFWQDPSGTTSVLVEQNWWYGWYHQQRLELNPDQRRQAALEWLRCRAWQKDNRSEATLEAWKQVIEDLPVLQGEDMQNLRKQVGENTFGGPLWPWIVPFEDRQIASLAQLSGDLGALAELAEAAEADQKRVDLDELLSASRFAKNGNVTMLSCLLTAQAGPSPPIFSLEESEYLVRHCGHRGDQALRARVHSVVTHLGVDPYQAVKAADDSDLWKNELFLEPLAGWLKKYTSPEDISKKALDHIEQRVPEDPNYPWQNTFACSPSLINGLLEQGYDRVAEFVAPDIHKRLEAEDLSRKVIDALYHDWRDDPCWQQIGRKRFTRDRHPFLMAATRIRNASALTEDVMRTLRESGWERFAAVIKIYPNLPEPVDDLPPRLPAFELTASLLGAGKIGQAAMGIMSVAGPYRHNVNWWNALLGSLRYGYHRYNADDRHDVALVLLIGFANEQFGIEERKGLVQALSQQGLHDYAKLLLISTEAKRK